MLCHAVLRHVVWVMCSAAWRRRPCCLLLRCAAAAAEQLLTPGLVDPFLCRAKTLAEWEAWAIAGQQERWKLVTLCPGMVYGPPVVRIDRGGEAPPPPPLLPPLGDAAAAAAGARCCC